GEGLRFDSVRGLEIAGQGHDRRSCLAAWNGSWNDLRHHGLDSMVTHSHCDWRGMTARQVRTDSLTAPAEYALLRTGMGRTGGRVQIVSSGRIVIGSEPMFPH